MTRAPLRPEFWTLPLSRLNAAEWEALCDGCGKCCLNKLEDEDTGEVHFTNVACRLLDGDSCRCTNYRRRKTFVPECVVLTAGTLKDISYWLPSTCAYRLRAEGKPLEPWHPLVSGDPDSVHKAGQSVRGRTVSEFTVPEDEWEDHIIEEP
ncbi:MAG: YcgN family cysteine cluster protein [Proteobacteria bacterium]|nr:YcgN family cysteine cluster protein [Pseudomonadota bacterium]MBS0573780.1 YcgN family cysteine cluster protein [Pseudomonadota bacterium]